MTVMTGVRWVTALAVGALLMAGMIGTTNVHAQGPSADNETGIAVYGDGELSAAPDVALINLGAQTEGQTAREAIDKNSTVMNAVIAALRGAGVLEGKIRTAGINITPIMAQGRQGEQTPVQPIGYRATNTVAVTVEDLSRAGAVLDAGISAGANVANGLRFGFSDESALRRQALEAAARAARLKAEALAGALGVRITGLRTVQEEANGAVPLARMSLAEAAPAGVPVQPGEMVVRARVRVVFNYA
jgi:uncharacterized protein